MSLKDSALHIQFFCDSHANWRWSHFRELAHIGSLYGFYSVNGGTIGCSKLIRAQVKQHLKNVRQIQATRDAFAALKADGSVVTWGDPDCGGDSRNVQDQLKLAGLRAVKFV